jgi:nucleoid DNA-binding protein
MTVKFNVVARGKPGDKVNQRDVAKMAAEVSTVSPADTAAVIENFLSIITSEIARGNIVQFG